MQILSMLGNKPDGTPTYTWIEALRFFVIGAMQGALGALPPVAFTLWYNYQHYSDAIDWTYTWGLITAAVSPALVLYWNGHRQLLKLPPWFEVPPEFQPVKSKTTERSEHTTTETTEMESGAVVTTKLSPHTSTTVVTGTGTGDGKPVIPKG